jgi:hypothetical protein
MMTQAKKPISALEVQLFIPAKLTPVPVMLTPLGS